MESKKKMVRVIGVKVAAEKLGVSACHVSLVARGMRPGSRKVRDAIQKYCKIVCL